MSNQSVKIGARLKRKEFNTLDSAIACMAFIILQLLFDLIRGNLPSSAIQEFIVAVFLMFMVEAVFGLASLITAGARRVEFFNATTLNKKVDLISILIAIALSFVCLFAFSGLTNVFVDFLSIVGYQSPISEIVIPNFETYILYVFLICVCPAVFEDLLFRGTILNGLKENGKHKAVIISALFFMLMHGGPDQTIHQFILGVVFGYALIASGSIWVPIIMHFINNFVAVTSLYVTSSSSGEILETSQQINIPSWGEWGLSLVFALLTAVAGAVIVYYLIKALKQLKDKKEKKQIDLADNLETINLSEKKQDNTTLSENMQINSTFVKEKTLSVIIFTISGAYLLINWILTLIGGLL